MLSLFQTARSRALPVVTDLTNAFRNPTRKRELLEGYVCRIINNLWALSGSRLRSDSKRKGNGLLPNESDFRSLSPTFKTASLSGRRRKKREFERRALRSLKSRVTVPRRGAPITIFHNTLNRTRFNGSLSSARYMSQSTAHSAPEINLSSDDHFPQASDFPQHESFTVDDTDSLGASVLPDQSSIEAAAVSLQDLGLGSYWPTGILQIAMDSLHTAGLPWWAAIATTTLALRALTFPLYLKTQRAMPEYFESLSELKETTQKMHEASKSGNREELQRLNKEMFTSDLRGRYVRANLKFMAPLIAQGPIFLSFFVALKQMSEAPVASMKHGGALWFTDLTVMDPYYALPAIVCATWFVMFKVGADVPTTGEVPSKIMYILPLVVFPFMKDFPAATLTFWVTTNLLSLGQTILLNNPGIRKILKLPPRSAMRLSLEKKMKEN